MHHIYLLRDWPFSVWIVCTGSCRVVGRTCWLSTICGNYFITSPSPTSSLSTICGDPQQHVMCGGCWLAGRELLTFPLTSWGLTQDKTYNGRSFLWFSKVLWLIVLVVYCQFQVLLILWYATLWLWPWNFWFCGELTVTHCGCGTPFGGSSWVRDTELQTLLGPDDTCPSLQAFLDQVKL